MAAEASIGGIGGDVPTNKYGIDGAACFNRVRTRANVGSKELTMANIQEERKFEFTGEYIRKFDLMRWGILKETLLKAHERLAQMNKHEGEFAQHNDSIYLKYKYVGDEYSYAAGIKGFIIDSVYGLNIGETDEPAFYNKENGWVKKCIYEGSSGRELAPDNYMLFDREPFHWQCKELLKVIEYPENEVKQERTLREMYLYGRLADIAYQVSGPDNNTSISFSDYKVYCQRNEQWTKRLKPYLTEGGAFITLNAIYLGGEKGLLQQLRAAGYRIRPVNRRTIKIK